MDISLPRNLLPRSAESPATGRGVWWVQAVALFYSLIESAKLCGVEPRAYLGEAAPLAIRSFGAVTLARDLK